jgi:hypothetical protein
MDRTAQDNFQVYFAEKLWEMIPSIYRHEDGLGENPGALRALIEILAEQAAILRRSHDRLWEDQFIELCSNWAVPYIGDLVSTRMVSALNERARRVDVAKTIYYRRRKGTLRVLEELISDIAGWEGKVVEMFTRLGRTRHGLDPRPGPLAGRFSGSLPGGWADFGQPHPAELAGGPFDEFFYTPDFRQQRGKDGLYNIPKLAFHLYRLGWFRLVGVTPFSLGDGARYTCDPSGRDTPLFMPRQRPADWDEWQTAREWELPAPISCHLLGHAEYLVTETLVRILEDDFAIPASAAGKMRSLRGFRLASEAQLKQVLDLFNEPSLLAAGAYHQILSDALVSDCGKAALLPEAILVEESPGLPVETADSAAGDLSQWPVSDPGKRLIIDPELGRLQFFGPAPDPANTINIYYGFSGSSGAGAYARPDVETSEPTSLPNLTASNSGGTIQANRIANDGVTQIDDSATYFGIGNKLSVVNLTLQAANQQRPYVRLTSNWILRTDPGADANLVLDGIWFGSQTSSQLILRGDYERVTIRSCTLDPGGANDALGDPIQYLALIIEANIETLVVENSILSQLSTQSGGQVDRLLVSDSILDANSPLDMAISLPQGTVELERVTIIGQVDVERLWATETLITGMVDVTDTQQGCFRFSAAPAGSRLPRPYQAFELIDPDPIFTSTKFGQPGYAQLSQAAPTEILRGAENGSEIGAFSGLLNPIKLDSLRAKIDEYMPFGLIPIFIMET